MWGLVQLSGSTCAFVSRLCAPAVALGSGAALKLGPLRCSDPSEVGKLRHPLPLFFPEQLQLQEEQL